MSWFDESHFLLHHADGWLRVLCLPKDEALRETLGPVNHEVVTYLSIVAMKVHSMLAKVFPKDCLLFQQESSFSASHTSVEP